MSEASEPDEKKVRVAGRRADAVSVGAASDWKRAVLRSASVPDGLENRGAIFERYAPREDERSVAASQ